MLRALPWLLVLASVVGCGGGHGAVATTGGDLGLFKVHSGSYAVADLATGSDGCQLGLDSSNFTTLALSNDGDGGLGSYRGSSGTLPHFVPSAYTAGNGRFSDGTHGMTMTQTHAIAADDTATPCQYDLTVATVLIVTGNDALHVQLSHRDDNISACTTPPGTSCSSTFTFDLRLPPAPDLATP
jgi:hypothetical protein